MKLNKKGFTLIELLAVIAILAILIVLAVPNILNLFSDSRVGALKVDAQSILESAQTQFQVDQLKTGAVKTCYVSSGVSCPNGYESKTLNADISPNSKYCVLIDADGIITRFDYSSSGYYAHATGTSTSGTTLGTTVKKSDVTLNQDSTKEAACSGS